MSQREKTETYVHVQVAQNHMATTFYFTISCPKKDSARAERLLLQAHAEVNRLENELSEFLETSCIYQLNHSDVGERVLLTESAIELLERAETIRSQTKGAFDCAAKSGAQALSASKRIAWNAASRQAWKLVEDATIGFGAIGKGFALDKIRIEIEREGFSDFVLNAGGSSLVFSGFSQPGVPWEWGWSWSKNAQSEWVGLPFSHVSGETIALGISGIHEKGHHILNSTDPKWKKVAMLQSALVAHTSATDADALSTALYVTGWEKGMKLFSDLTASPALAVIDQEGTPRWNGIFQKKWGTPGGNHTANALFWLSAATSLLSTEVFAQSKGEEVNLEDLGSEDFNPYRTERSDLWLILPAFAVILTLIHLKKFIQKKYKPLGGAP